MFLFWKTTILNWKEKGWKEIKEQQHNWKTKATITSQFKKKKKKKKIETCLKAKGKLKNMANITFHF